MYHVAFENLILQSTYPEYEPASCIESKEEFNQLHRIMEQLPEVLKITLDLKYFYDYSNKEISKILNIPVKTVEMRLYRAKIRLKELLENEK